MNQAEKQRSFDRGGTITVHLFLKPPGKDGTWKGGGEYRDGFNVFCTTSGSANEPRLRSRHLPPAVAETLADALDTLVGSDGGSSRSAAEWVKDSLDLMPAALATAISEAEKHVHELRRIQSALTGRY